ncbi:MAG: ABC transporter permease [Candidatus Symbiobacter sp.]|nr:ABC transporter permease [Candidatus Symbiobacter sp.]
MTTAILPPHPAKPPHQRKTGLLYPAAGLVLFMLICEGLARSGLAPAILVPIPSQVPLALISEIKNGIYFPMILHSLHHYSLGLVMGSCCGIALGITCGLSPRTDQILAWVLRVLRPIPSIAWIPFSIIWFGIGEGAAAFVISISVFWLNFFASYVAVKGVNPDDLELAAAFGHGGWWRRVVKIIIPAAAPGMMGGIRSALGQGWMAVVAAELFGVAGVGMRLNEASGLLATNVVLLYMLTIAALYGLVDMVFLWVQRRIMPWQR